LAATLLLFAQAYVGDLTRVAIVTLSEVMAGYAFIMGASYRPGNTKGLEFAAGDSLMRSV
jgi:hypothetical protein